MEPAPPGGEHPGIGGIAHERVAEPPCAGLGPRHDQRSLDEALEGALGDRLFKKGDEVLGLKGDANHGRDSEHVAGGLIKAVDARPEDRTQSQRKTRRTGLDQRHPAIPELERAILDRRPDGLADEQRIAFGPVVDPLGIVGVERSAGDDRGKTRRLRRLETAEWRCVRRAEGPPTTERRRDASWRGRQAVAPPSS